VRFLPAKRPDRRGRRSPRAARFRAPARRGAAVAARSGL